MAWNKLVPSNNELLQDAPALIRANWDAIALATDPVLIIDNDKVSASANIEGSKLKCTGGTQDNLISLDASLNLQDSGKQYVDYIETPSGSAQGDILIRDGSGWVELVAGTAGKSLTTNGIGADPSWESPQAFSTGMVLDWAGTIASVPTGWIFCDGSAISRVTYASLFSAIGTIYGVGDGSTTFNLPNLVDKFVVGAKQDDSGVPKTNISGALTQSGGNATHTLITSEIAPHIHTGGAMYIGSYSYSPGSGGYVVGNSTGSPLNILSGTLGNTGGDTAHNNVPSFLAVAGIIRT